MKFEIKPGQLATHESNVRFIIAALVIVALFALLPSVAHAQSTGGLPWETFGCKLASQLTGPWVKWMAVIAVALGGVMFGLGELSGPFKKVMEIIGGFTIALGATGVVATLLPSTGGTLGTC